MRREKRLRLKLSRTSHLESSVAHLTGNGHTGTPDSTHSEPIYNSSYVRLGELISKEFKIGRGKDWAAYFLQLCSIYMENRSSEGQYGDGVLIGGRLVSNIRYANNTVLLARSEQDIAKLLLRIEMISGEVGLELNRGKCQLLMIDRAYISEENSAISWDIGVVDDASISVP
ncbi:hypothetical protein LAZ67_1007081 [Cordylochernes scorpioides]|uniref:Reverse transcriptase n=1 Tax=Cordylochernes scorpioides TaxID=51811 RepID=A0ABY6JZB3_9ARAC|nr:hypothetical protein LAZ67_1007081 [Cordylochernes scorpioides]